MKKSLLTAGLASVAIAAMPVVGVFAASGSTVTDTVQVTINSACSITTSGNAGTGADAGAFTYTKTMTNGQLLNTEDTDGFGSTAMTINCNDHGGWHVTAVGSGADANDKTVMNASSTGTDIATGTAISGATSNWAFKVTGAVGTTTSDYHTNYAAVPSTAQDVAVSASSSAGSVINTHYQVWISPAQEADTYTGQVTYTLAHPAS